MSRTARYLEYHTIFAPVGFQLEVERFFIYYLLLNLVSIAAVSIAFSISAAIRVGAVANLLIAIVFVVSMVIIFIGSSN